MRRPLTRARNRRELANGRRVAPTPELVPAESIPEPEPEQDYKELLEEHSSGQHDDYPNRHGYRCKLTRATQ